MVEKTPLLTAGFAQLSNGIAVTHMWLNHTAAGQSVFVWILAIVVLSLNLNYFRRCAPQLKWQRIAIYMSFGFNIAGLITVLILSH